MKMGTALFWGLLLILIGLGIVIRVVFNINFPLIKFAIAFFFIFIGIKLLIGNVDFWHGHSDGANTIFTESRINDIEGKYKEYNIVFGSSLLDLRDIDLAQGSKEIKVNTVFGNTVIKINKDVPLKIKTDAAFASAKLPNGNTAAFGTGRYESDSFSRDTNYIYIKADVVFGGFEVRTY